MLDEAGPHLDDPLQRALAQRLQGSIGAALGQAVETQVVLLAAARSLKPHDVPLARDTLLEALSSAIYSGRFGSGGLHEIAMEARATPLPDGVSASCGDLLLDGFAMLFSDGHEAAAPLLRDAVNALEASELVSEEALRWLGFGCLAAGVLGDNETLRRLAGRLEKIARDQGALLALNRGLYFLAMAEMVAGSLGAAAEHFAEGRDLMAARGDPAGLGQVMILAWAGREEDARAEADTVIRTSTERGQTGVLVTYAEYALGVLELSLGNYEAALTHALRSHAEDSFSYFLSTVALPDLVEAGARGGDRSAAETALELLELRALVNGTTLSLGMAARAGALLADDDAAEAFYVAAIAHLSDHGGVGHLGRAHLLYGEWLRRQNRRVDAREHLRAAFNLFTTMGAEAWGSGRASSSQQRGARPEAHRGDPRRPDAAGSSDRAPRRRPRHEPRDRGADVHQREHRGVPPAQGVPEARRQLETSAPRRPPRPLATCGGA